MSFFGKEYKLEKQENFDGFLKSMSSDISEDQIKAFLAHKPIAKLTKDGDTYTLTTSRPGHDNFAVCFKLGAVVDENINGKAAKTTFTMDGNTLTQVQTYENGVTMTFKREFSDNEMVTTCTNSIWDGEARRYYKA